MKNSKITVYLLIVLALTLSLALASCGTQPAAQAPTAAPAEAAAESDSSSSDSFSFSAAAIDGSTVDESIFEGKSLIMINLWEPWCGPCVQEMPDLQKLYEEYKDQGFLLIGAYNTDNGAADIVKELGISYPIVKMCPEFAQFQTQYVPTTVFLDGEGNLLSEQIVGGASYDQWKARIEDFLPAGA